VPRTCLALRAVAAGLGQSLLREGLVKDDNGRDVQLPAGGGAAPAAAAGPAGAGPADAAGPGAGQGAGEEGLVEWEGMLVSGAVAQRRG
jgi:F-type H+-transporting ATPase subunit alpha